ncbi:MAG: TIGR03790 family protein, partial [Thermodesulfobacteriota bacterium]|nr:TIGR03790 family protein [Thermodesulfobacteriota bacterium]
MTFRIATPNLRYWFFLLLFGAGLLLSTPCPALEPKEILVLANRNAFHSVGLAKYYIKKRGIPKDNLVKLWVTDEEHCSRDDYEKKVAEPVKNYLEKNDRHRSIRCLVIMYGVPLRVAPPEMTSQEKAEFEQLQKKRGDLNEQLEVTGNEEKEKTEKLRNEVGSIKKKISFLKKTDHASSLDSEIALIMAGDYPLARWAPNPYFLGYRGKQIKNMPQDVLMVSRLDGPSEKIVRKIIDDSLLAEENGLNGKAYFDARWPDVGDKKTSSNGFYDRSIHRTADLINKVDLMPVVVESSQKLFQPGDCPDAALYCGWYRLSRYVDAFQWQPGAVGYHIASGECATLKRKGSRVWCKVMLEKGVAATVGPVGEPYLQAFAVPEIFFASLIKG